MSLLKDVRIGERFEVQPKNFHRKFIGKIDHLQGDQIVFEVENFASCDQEKINSDRLIEVDRMDIKKHLSEDCFFS